MAECLKCGETVYAADRVVALGGALCAAAPLFAACVHAHWRIRPPARVRAHARLPHAAVARRAASELQRLRARASAAQPRRRARNWQRHFV
jgi:hypothetical protein